MLSGMAPTASFSLPAGISRREPWSGMGIVLYPVFSGVSRASLPIHGPPVGIVTLTGRADEEQPTFGWRHIAQESPRAENPSEDPTRRFVVSAPSRETPRR